MIDEVEFEVGVALLVACHGFVPQVIHTDIAHTLREGIREPLIHQSSSCLYRLCFRSGEGHQVDTRGVVVVVEHCKSGYRFIPEVADVTSDIFRIDRADLSVVLDVVVLEKMTDPRLSECIDENLRRYRFDPSIRAREEFFPGSTSSLVPFFEILRSVDDCESGTSESGREPKPTPTLRDIRPSVWCPYDDSAVES